MFALLDIVKKPIEINFKTFFSKKFALNTGVRYEKSKLINKSSLSPRFSMAYKISKYSQTSYAYGQYFQTPELGFDQWYRRNNINFNSLDNANLEFEKSKHHILNYEWSKKKKMLRLEIFEKTYSDLITLHEKIIFKMNLESEEYILPFPDTTFEIMDIV